MLIMIYKAMLTYFCIGIVMMNDIDIWHRGQTQHEEYYKVKSKRVHHNK